MHDLSSREVISMLNKQGWREVRRNGGDVILSREGSIRHVKVPTNRKSIAKGTQKSIEKQAEVKFS